MTHATDTTISRVRVDDDKPFHTVRARLALKGYCLNRSEAADGPRSYFVSKWNLGRDLATLEDVEAFARSVGAAAE